MIGLLRRLHANLRLLRAAVAPLRQRGRSLVAVLLWQLPVAVALRGWRVLAQPLNARLLNRLFNASRFASFQDALPATVALRWYVIVMPYTLHFLLPCIKLLLKQEPAVPLVLLANGAKAWERTLLRARLPGLPMFTLCTLPGSSLGHGDALNLLLEHHRGDFGIVDHDAYVFDPAQLGRMQPAANECMVTVFSQTSRRTGSAYPLTHLLSFNAEALRQLMHRYRIDARQCRQAPDRLAGMLARVGLGPRAYLKDYQSFHDTLHVLLGVAMAEGLRVRFEPQGATPLVMHVGGTSIGTHHTKNLFALYVHLRFLELLDDPLIGMRYRFLTHPLRSAAEALERRPAGDRAWSTLALLDELMRQLQAAGACRAFALTRQIA